MEEIRRFRETDYGTTKSGLVINMKTKRIVTGHLVKDYVRIKLGKGGTTYGAHKMVAECWIPVPEELKDCPTLQVDHINGVRYDNRVENLRWVSAKMNRANPITYSKLLKPVAAYYPNGDLYKKYKSMAEAVKDGFCRNCIYKAINHIDGMVYHYGLMWKFIEKDR